MSILKSISFSGILFLTILMTADGIAVMSIDLGCEWMKIAVVSPGKPMEIAMNKESLRKTPVAVSFRNGERLIGDAAMSTAVRFPENTYHHFLDLLGKSIDHPEVKRFQKRFPHHKMSSVPERNTVFFHHKENIDFTPEELLAMVLTKAQEIAQDFTEQKITDCVITVPPYFNQGERRAVIDAARFAGLKVLQLINSNVAAALNYGVFRRKDFNATPQNIMLYDMGAANTVATIFSYQVVKTKEAGYVEENPQVSVKGMGYDRTLGGLEMQLRLRDHLANLFNDQKKTSTDVFTSPQALSKLFKEAGKTKHVLSANDHYFAQIEGLLEDIDFKAKVTREDFMKLISDVLEKVNNPIQMALEDAGMTMNHIEQLILVGGGTRVPKIQELLLEFSKKDLGKNLNTDEAPALGAAYQAAYLSTGFKVKIFAVRDSNLYPIQAHFSREIEKEDSVKEIRQIKRMLFSHQNPYPQKKVMTFNKHVDDFNFFINYGELDFLPEDLRRVDMSNISKIKIKGVKNVLSKHNEEDTESKGIKAHFRMDESGILHLDKVETEFKKKMAVEEEPSTLSKIGSTISNLFSGSKEEEKAGEEIEKNDKPTDTEANKTKEESKKDSKDSKDSKPETTDFKNNATANATTNATSSTNAKKDTKQITVKEPIKSSVLYLDISSFNEDLEKTIKERLEKLDADDRKKKEREAARNNVESFAFDMQHKLYQPEYETATTEEEREKVRSKLSEVSDWLDEESEEQEAQVYQKKLTALKDLTSDITNRVKEHAKRPEAWEALFNTLNISRFFLSTIKNVSEEESVFTDVEIQTLEKAINETTKWETEMKAEQIAVPLTEKPKVTVYMIAEKINNLDREIKYLLSKSKLATPKSKQGNKPPTDSGKNKTDSKESNKTSESEKEATSNKSDSGDRKAEDDPDSKTDTKSEDTPDSKTDSKSEDAPDSKTDTKSEDSKATEETLELPGPETATDNSEDKKSSETSTDKTPTEGSHGEL